MRKPTHSSGFTLIESIIYVGICGSIMAAVMLSSYSLIEASQAVAEKNYADEDANFVLGKINWAMTAARQITGPPPGATASYLTLNTSDSSQNPLTFVLTIGRIALTRHGGGKQDLTGSEVEVSELSFTHIPASGQKPEAVLTKMVINGRTYTSLKYLRQ